jgi:hypothetical protein
MFAPVCVRQMAELASRLGLERVPTLMEALEVDVAGHMVEKGDPLFPRIDRP